MGTLSYLHMTLHLLECLNELIKIFDIEHYRGLLPSTRLLRDLEKLPIRRLLKIDVERALARMNRNRVYVIRKLPPLLRGTNATGNTIIGTLRTLKIGHGIEHRERVKEVKSSPTSPLHSQQTLIGIVCTRAFSV